MKNILIFNPLISLNKNTRELIFDPDIPSFIEAMKYINENLDHINNIFLFADSPPHISSYKELFRNKSDIRRKNGVHKLRTLGQFRPEISEAFEKYLPKGININQIFVILKSSCYSLLLKIDPEHLDSFPTCRVSKNTQFSCSSIVAIASKIAMQDINVSNLVLITNIKNKRTPLDILLEGAYYARDSWYPEKNIIIKTS